MQKRTFYATSAPSDHLPPDPVDPADWNFFEERMKLLQGYEDYVQERKHILESAKLLDLFELEKDTWFTENTTS